MTNFIIVFLTVLYKYVFVVTKHQYMKLYIAILLLIFILCAIKISSQMLNGKMPYLQQWPASTLIILLIVAYLTIVGNDANFLVPFFLAIVFSYDNKERFLKNFLISSAIIFAVHNILNLTGIIPDPFKLVRINNGVYTLRSTMGFEHPNNGFLFLLPIVFGIYYFAKTTKLRIIGMFISLMLSLYVYYRTMTRTGLVIIGYLLIMYFLESQISKHKILLKIGRYSYFVIAILSIFIAYRHGLNADDTITTILSGRPFIWNIYINQGLHLFGNGIAPDISSSDFAPGYGSSLDNYYIFMLSYYGFVGFFAIGIMYYNLLKYLEKKQEIKLYFITIAFLTYGFTEANIMIFSINFSQIFLFLPYLISKNVKFAQN